MSENTASGLGIGREHNFVLGTCIGVNSNQILQEIPGASERCLDYRFVSSFNSLLKTGTISATVTKN